MESDRKRRIRRISIPLFWISEAILLFGLVVGIYVKYYEEELPEAMIGAQAVDELVMADKLLTHTMSRVWLQREENLIRYLPPEDKSNLSEWAAHVRDHMDVECAVFLYDGKIMRWPLLPSQFESMVSRADSLARYRVVDDSTGRRKLIGNFETLTLFSQETEQPRIQIVGPTESVLRWGVVYNFPDCYWHSFARKLAASRSYTFDPDLAEFSAVFDMEKWATVPDSVPNRSKFGLQIFTQSDSLLFETPGIDTSFHKFEQRHDVMPVYTIVYNTWRNEEFLRMVRGYFAEDFDVPWHKLVLPIFLMFVLALFHHWIDKLTRE